MNQDETRQHDSAYKYLFKNKRIFLQLLSSFVHEEFVQKITTDDLELVDKSFVSQELLEREADLLYKVMIDGKEGYIYIWGFTETDLLTRGSQKLNELRGKIIAGGSFWDRPY